MMKTCLHIFVLLSIAFPVFASAGTMTSGGIVQIIPEAMFFGPEPVLYCVSRSPQFSLDLDSARADIAAALQEWGAYRQGFDAREGRGGGPRDVSLVYREVSCTDSAVSLHFDLGSSRTESTFLTTDRNPNQDARGSAVIWVAPDLGASSNRYYGSDLRGAKRAMPIWSDRVRFENTIRHEIGHLFGFDHRSDNSVMSVQVLLEQVAVASPAGLAPLPKDP